MLFRSLGSPNSGQLGRKTGQRSAIDPSVHPVTNLLKQLKMSSLFNNKAIWLALLGSTASWAGRPLSVDDANVNESGAGHVEMWVSREAAKGNLYNIAPAYAVADGVEIGALLSRDSAAQETLTALQAKWRITASQRARQQRHFSDRCTHRNLQGSATRRHRWPLCRQCGVQRWHESAVLNGPI